MSSQILVERKQYYEILQKVQHSLGDITEWFEWFLHCLKNAMFATESTTEKIVRKAEFWKLHEHTGEKRADTTNLYPRNLFRNMPPTSHLLL